MGGQSGMIPARDGRRAEKAWLLLLWLLVIAERIAFTLWDKTGQSFIVTDSQFYYQSGLDLIKTGRLIYRGCPTALIMPGISVLIGLLSLAFPDGPALVYAVRVLWILMGSLVPVIVYRSLRLFTGHWCALLGAAVYLMPWHVQIDCFLLTECPYYLFLPWRSIICSKWARTRISAWSGAGRSPFCWACCSARTS